MPPGKMVIVNIVRTVVVFKEKTEVGMTLLNKGIILSKVDMEYHKRNLANYSPHKMGCVKFAQLIWRITTLAWIIAILLVKFEASYANHAIPCLGMLKMIYRYYPLLSSI